MSEDPALASLSLTHISYDPNDPVSYLSAWLSLVPQGLIVAYVSLCWASREIEVIMCFAGQLACEALNFALKRIIREERPNTRFRGKGYGMPSSHAQFMAFFCVYMSLFLILRHQPARRGPISSLASSSSFLSFIIPSQFTQQVITSILLIFNAAGVAASRVYLNYHTERQVYVGCAVGAGFALVWFLVTKVVRDSGLLQWALDLEVVRLFRIRDLLLDQDLADAGWKEYEARREAAAKAIKNKAGDKKSR